MLPIMSHNELREWFKGKPQNFVQVVAARAALRMLPYAFGARSHEKWVNDYALALFQATSISWTTQDFPGQKVALAATVAADVAGNAAAYAVNYVADAAAATAAAGAAHAARAAAARAHHTNAAAIAAVANVVEAAAAVDAEFVPVAVWANINNDCVWLEHEEDRYSAGCRLAHEPLWPAGEPADWGNAWAFAKTRLLDLDQGYDVWIDWFDRRLRGEKEAFAIPGDVNRVEDKKILAALADASNKDFWRKGAAHVNATLQSWIDEAYERLWKDSHPHETPPPSSETIRAVAAEVASPTVTVTNNALDVIANSAFDGQTDGINLDEAIAILRAVVGALLGGLPGNAPRSFAVNLTIYDGELAKRDAKPFIGVLVRMEKSVSAGFHADPEMFDASVIANFESFFEAHLAFLVHYRRNEEREAKIAQFKIDDCAASGEALRGPVDEVVKEVDALAEQGLVTDGFVQAINEQKAMNDELALYTTSVPANRDEPTVKERHIFQTVGFYERALAVAADVVTVGPSLAAFIIVLKEAIEALLKFFV